MINVGMSKEDRLHILRVERKFQILFVWFSQIVLKHATVDQEQPLAAFKEMAGT